MKNIYSKAYPPVKVLPRMPAQGQFEPRIETSVSGLHKLKNWLNKS